MYFQLTFEWFDYLIGGGDADTYTDLHDSSPHKNTLRQWIDRVGIAAEPEEFISFGVWGDSATYNTRDSLFLILYNALSGSCRDRHWFCAWPKKIMCRCGCAGRQRCWARQQRTWTRLDSASCCAGLRKPRRLSGDWARQQRAWTRVDNAAGARGRGGGLSLGTWRAAAPWLGVAGVFAHGAAAWSQHHRQKHTQAHREVRARLRQCA